MLSTLINEPRSNSFVLREYWQNVALIPKRSEEFGISERIVSERERERRLIYE